MGAYFYRILNAYGRLVDKSPILTQIMTAGSLVTVGDVLAQTIIEKKERFDFRRTAIMAACGFGYFGPLVGFWFSALNKWGLPAVVCVALDQLTFAPPLLAGFFTIQHVLNGKSLTAGVNRVKNELPGVIKVNWTVWIPAQIINFWLLPFQYRMLFCQVVALFWNCYLSNKANHDLQPEACAVNHTD